MLDKEMWYKIPTYQMQYDANNKETDHKDQSHLSSHLSPLTSEVVVAPEMTL